MNTKELNNKNYFKKKCITSIRELLEFKDYISIHKVDMESNSSQKINLNIGTRNITISDGKYVINRGTGWVLGNDESMVETASSDSGIGARINVKQTISATSRLEFGASLELNVGVLSVSVEAAVGRAITKSDSLAFEFERTAPIGKKLYMKAYATFNRFDVMNIKGGKIESIAILYEPEGGWLKYTEYDIDSDIDKKTMIEFTDRCVLGEINNHINCSIDVYSRSNEKCFTILVNNKERILLLTNNLNNINLDSSNSNSRYFSMTIKDKNGKIKLELNLNGGINGENNELLKVDRFAFEEDDYIEMYCKHSNSVKIVGNLINENGIHEDYPNGMSIYKLVFTKFILGRENIRTIYEAPILNTINIHDLNYNEVFKIAIDKQNKMIRVLGKKDTYLAPENMTARDNIYFTFQILDKNNIEKISIDLKGDDKGTSNKLDKINNFKYEVGDKIKLYKWIYISSRLLTISGKVTDATSDYSKGASSELLENTIFELTDSYLKEVKVNEEAEIIGEILFNSKEMNTMDDFIDIPMFKLNIKNNNIINFIPLLPVPFSTEYREDMKFINIKIINELGKNTLDVDMLAGDTSYSGKFDKLREIKFVSGDILKIYHYEVMNDTYMKGVIANQYKATTNNDYSNGFTKKQLEETVFILENNALIEKNINRNITVKESKGFDINSKGLADGLYVASKGIPVIRKEKNSFIKSAIIPAGVIGSIEKEKIVGIENNVDFAISAGFNSEYVSMTLKSAFGKTFGDEKTILAKYLNVIDDNNNIFLKTYLIEQAIETYRVRASKVIDKAVTYEPIGTFARQLVYSPGSTANQNLLWQSTEVNEYTGQPYNKEILDYLIPRENKGTLTMSNNTFTSRNYSRDKAIAFLFTPYESGRYSIKNATSYMEPLNSNTNPMYTDYSANANMRLVRIAAGSDALIREQIFRVPSDIQKVSESNYKNLDRSRSYEVDLFLGESYALIIGPNHGLGRWSSYPDPIQYKVRIDKK